MPRIIVKNNDMFLIKYSHSIKWTDRGKKNNVSEQTNILRISIHAQNRRKIHLSRFTANFNAINAHIRPRLIIVHENMMQTHNTP